MFERFASWFRRRWVSPAGFEGFDMFEGLERFERFASWFRRESASNSTGKTATYRFVQQPPGALGHGWVGESNPAVLRSCGQPTREVAQKGVQAISLSCGLAGSRPVILPRKVSKQSCTLAVLRANDLQDRPEECAGNLAVFRCCGTQPRSPQSTGATGGGWALLLFNHFIVLRAADP